MALATTDLVGNARVNYDGSEGVVVSTNPHLTLIEREGGKVDTYVTSYVMEGAEVVQSEAQQQEEAASQDSKDAQIADLQRQLDEAHSRQNT